MSNSAVTVSTPAARAYAKSCSYRLRARSDTARARAYDDAVYVQERLVPLGEPPVVDAVVIDAFAKGQHEAYDYAAVVLFQHPVQRGGAVQRFQPLPREGGEDRDGLFVQREHR